MACLIRLQRLDEATETAQKVANSIQEPCCIVREFGGFAHLDADGWTLVAWYPLADALELGLTPSETFHPRANAAPMSDPISDAFCDAAMAHATPYGGD